MGRARLLLKAQDAVGDFQGMGRGLNERDWGSGLGGFCMRQQMKKVHLRVNDLRVFGQLPCLFGPYTSLKMS